MTIPAVMEIGTDRLFVERPAVCAVFAFLAGRLSLDVYATVKIEPLARQIGIHADTAGDALRILCAHGYLLCKPLDGRTREYKLVYRRVKPLETPSVR